MQYEHYRDGTQYFHIGKNISHGHFHRSLELLYCIEKSRTVTLDGEDMTLCEGQLALVPPFCTHIFPLCEGHTSLCCVLPVAYTDIMDNNSGGKVPRAQIIAQPVAGEIYALLVKLDGETEPLVRNGIYTYIVGLLLKYADFSEVKSGEGDFRMRVLRYIEKHYAEKIGIDSFAAELGYNRYYFSALFNRTFGVHFKDYLNMVRINKSFALLGTCSVSSAAQSIGYANEQSFYTNFKKITGMTPHTYITSNKK